MFYRDKSREMLQIIKDFLQSNLMFKLRKYPYIRISVSGPQHFAKIYTVQVFKSTVISSVAVVAVEESANKKQA
jgi:hypothetical protein